VLKSIWLEGKRNWHVDHLIHTLVVEFLLDLKMHHKWQELGMHGGDLAEQHRQQILRHAPETPLTQIRKIDDLHFEVQSSNSNKSYNIDLQWAPKALQCFAVSVCMQCDALWNGNHT
jgi:hypothetical protein